MSQSKVVFETKDYEVILGEMRMEPALGHRGYLVRNKVYDVVEGEVTVEYAAVSAAKELQRERDAIYADSTNEVEMDEEQFNNFLANLESQPEK